MRVTRKPLWAGAVAALLMVATSVGGQSLDALAERAVEEEKLLAELAQPDLATWESVERKIMRLWSQSGSDTIDHLLKRGEAAMEEEEYLKALEHFTVVTDHAPDFAEGWHARSIAFFMLDEYGLALLDIERTLALNPRHFGALSGVGVIYEEMGEFDLALQAMRLAHDLNPHRENITDAIKRLEQQVGRSTL